MKKLLTASLFIAIVMLSGCLSALYPLFTEKDLVFDSKLIGSWRANGDSTLYTFQQGSPQSFKGLPADLQRLSSKGYVLTVSEAKDGKNVGLKYYVFLARIGKHLYLDYFPGETQWQQSYSAFYRKGFMPLHSFYRLGEGVDRNSLTITRFADSYLRSLIDKKQIRIRHEQRLDGSYVITASTDELQQYVLKYGEVNEAYEDNKTFTRIK